MNPLFYEKTKDGEMLQDVYARLIKDRVIFLNEEIEPEAAGIICALMFLMDTENSEKPISLWIQSPGGDVNSFFAIYDMMQLVKAPIKTVCIGSASSAAAMLLASGTQGLRYATPNSTIMIHQIQVDGIRGSGTEIEIESKELKKIKDRLNSILARHTGKTVAKIKRDCEHDNYFDAQAAMEYGIIDHVLGPTKTLPEIKTRSSKKSDETKEE